jgi:hypothetical protein
VGGMVELDYNLMAYAQKTIFVYKNINTKFNDIGISGENKYKIYQQQFLTLSEAQTNH